MVRRLDQHRKQFLQREDNWNLSHLKDFFYQLRDDMELCGTFTALTCGRNIDQAGCKKQFQEEKNN